MADTKIKKLSCNPKALKVLAECVGDNLPDKDIQQRLAKECGYKWTLNTIARQRRAMGVNKNNQKSDEKVSTKTPNMTLPPPGMPESEKAEWFRKQFRESHLYKIMKLQFEAEEINVYMEEFGSVCCQFEDIVTTEFMQIDDFLKHRILINRQLIHQKMIQEEINDLVLWHAANPRQEDEDKDITRHRAMQQQALDNKYSIMESSNRRYDALVKERQRIYSDLNATRRSRLDELKGGKETFLHLVSRLQHSQEERQKQGKFAELSRLAAQDVKERFRQPHEFPDGSVEEIIMDAETEFGEQSGE